MKIRWQAVVGILASIAIIGCVVDEENDGINSNAATSASRGTAAPEVTFAGLDGSKQSLSSLKGKVVMIDFWGPSCPPCVRSLPFTQRLNDTFKDKGLAVLAVTTESKDSVTSFLKRKNYTFPTYLDDGPAADKFKIDAIPHTIIIDRAGKIVSEELGLTPQADTIEQLTAAGLDTSGFLPKNDPTQPASSG